MQEQIAPVRERQRFSETLTNCKLGLPGLQTAGTIQASASGRRRNEQLTTMGVEKYRAKCLATCQWLDPAIPKTKIMQEIVYKCDKCKKDLGQNQNISLNFGRYSGIAIPPSISDLVGFSAGWRVFPNITNQFLHFCSVKCLTAFFTKLWKEANAETKPKKSSKKPRYDI